MKVSGVMLNSEDPKALGEFYTKFLGKPGWVDEEGGWYGFGDQASSLMVGPHSEVKGKNKAPARHIMFLSCDDVKADFAKIKKAANPKVIAEPYQPDEKSMPDMWLATLQDPDGNYFQLSTPWEE